jgi:hypothetical protein
MIQSYERNGMRRAEQKYRAYEKRTHTSWLIDLVECDAYHWYGCSKSNSPKLAKLSEDSRLGVVFLAI